MSEAGFSGGIVNGTRVYVGMEANYGSLMAFADDEVQTVRESKLSDVFCELLKVLRLGQECG